MYLYFFVNNETHKIYVGVSTGHIKSLRRIKNHITRAFKGDTSPLYEDIRNLGIANFSIFIYDCNHMTVDDLLNAEKFCIRFFDSLYPNGYNRTIGGQGVKGWRALQTPERLKELQQCDSMRSQKMWANPVLRKKILAGMKDSWRRRKETDLEAIIKLSSERSKKIWSSKELTEEHRRRYSDAQKKRAHDETPIDREKRRDSLASGRTKRWSLKYPDGRIVEVEDIHNYCKLNNLPYNRIYNTHRYNRPDKDGWVLNEIY